MKVIGGVNDDDPSSVFPAGDGGYIVFGTTSSFGAGGKDFYLVHLDADGNELWHKTYGGPEDETGAMCRPTTDGGYIMIGTTLSYGLGGGDMYVVKVDGTGNIQHEKTYGTTGVDKGYAVRQTADGGYILAGQTYNSNQGIDFYLVKIDADWTSPWQQLATLGRPSYDDYCIDVVQKQNGGYLLVGNESIKSGEFEIVSTDSLGNLSKFYVELQETESYVGAVGVVSANKYCGFGSAITGTDPTSQIHSGFIFQCDNNAAITATAAIGNGTSNYAFNSGIVLSDGYIGVGYTSNTSNGKNDIFVAKTDFANNVLWSHTYGGADNDQGYCIAPTPDGGYIIAGSTKSFRSGNEGDDILVIKTDAAGNVAN